MRKAEGFYQKQAWKKVRDAYVKHRQMIDGGMCERCGERLGYIVHHKEHLTSPDMNDLSIAYGFDNLEYLCLDCHNEEHYRDLHKNDAVCLFDASGNPIDARGL